ncbi:MAG: hypothetical protein M3O50_21580 [Myxococcota bacterium]|nr:hypothetical protein [Myxococcota bacterium]
MTVATAVLALVARASVGLIALSKCPGVQGKGFGTRFKGADPVRPLPWLTPTVGRRLCLVVHALLVIAVVWNWVAPA